MNKERFVELIGKMEQGSASEAELRELDALYDTFEQNPGFTGQMPLKEKKEQAEKLFEKISAQTKPVSLSNTGSLYHKAWIAIAASICLIAFWWGYSRLFQSNHPENPARLAHLSNDAPPAKDKARLTLSGGKSILLDESALDKLDDIHFSINAEGVLIYQATDAFSGISSGGHHTITTPKGGRYQVILPDGTRVWLNSESSLTFPIAFAKEKRSVTMSGEVYFEVAKVQGKQGRVPFIVETPKQQIEVLGTRFNVTAYSGQISEVTTLVEGSVRVKERSESQMAILKPGQQALLESGKMNVRTANIEKEMAWKNGMFRFEDDNIRTVMQQLENWYDVDIDYKNMPEVHFNGGISRNLPLSRVLGMLEVTGGFKFEINAKKVKIISNKQIVNP